MSAPVAPLIRALAVSEVTDQRLRWNGRSASSERPGPEGVRHLTNWIVVRQISIFDFAESRKYPPE